METIWKHWKSGWSVFGRIFPFLFVACILFLPLEMLDLVLLDRDSAVFDDNGFHWQPAVSFLITLIWFPITLSIAARTTGCFCDDNQEEENDTRAL